MLNVFPYYVKSADHGATFSSPVPMVEQASRQPGLVFSSAAMAVGNSAAIYVAMITNNWKMKLAGVPDVETKRAENDDFVSRPGIRLGAGGAVGSSNPFRAPQKH
jgi:hypothetical protein